MLPRGPRRKAATLSLAVAAGLGSCREPNPAYIRRNLQDDDASAQDGGGKPEVGPLRDGAVVPPDGATPSLDTALPDAPVYGADFPQGLVGHWRFDEADGTIARDSSRVRQDGELRGFEGSRPWVPGVRGNALSFSHEAYVRVPRSPALDAALSLGRFTVAMWAAPGSQPRTNEALLSRQIGATTLDHVALFLDDGRFGARVIAADSKTTAACSVPTAAASDIWIPLALVLDGTALRLFVGGAEACFAAFSLRLAPDETPLRLGGSNDGATDRNIAPWSGRLDEVMLFDRALSPDELRRL